MIPENELDGHRLASEIEKLYMHPEAIKKMEIASASLGNRKAAVAIMDIIAGEIIDRGPAPVPFIS